MRISPKDVIHAGPKARFVCNMLELSGVADSCQLNGWLGLAVSIRHDADSPWSHRRFSPEPLLTVVGRAHRPFSWGMVVGIFYALRRKCISGLRRLETAPISRSRFRRIASAEDSAAKSE